MDARIFLLSCLLTGSFAAAQAQDPDKPTRAPAEVITELTREKERLESEIRFVRERLGVAKKELAAKLGKRGQELRAIKFELPKPAPVARPQARKARVMDDAERAANGADVLLLANGQPVRESEFREVVAYLETVPNAGDAAMRQQRALFDLMRTATVLAALPENAAGAELADVVGKLQQGAKVAELVKQTGIVPGAQPDGTLEVGKNSFLGPKFEQMAFSTPIGTVSRPFATMHGYVILEPLELRKSEDGVETIQVIALQIPWRSTPDELQGAQSAAATGQVDVVVRDEGVTPMLPASYRAAEQLDYELGVLKSTLEGIDAEIAKIEAAGEGSDTTRLTALRDQQQRLQKAIAELAARMDRQASDATPPGVDTAPVKPPVKK